MNQVAPVKAMKMKSFLVNNLIGSLVFPRKVAAMIVSVAKTTSRLLV